MAKDQQPKPKKLETIDQTILAHRIKHMREELEDYLHSVRELSSLNFAVPQNSSHLFYVQGLISELQRYHQELSP